VSARVEQSHSGRRAEDKDLEPQRHKGHKENSIKKGSREQRPKKTNHENTKFKKHEMFKNIFVFSFFRVFVMEVFNSTLDVDGFVKSLKTSLNVIPAKAGTQ